MKILRSLKSKQDMRLRISTEAIEALKADPPRPKKVCELEDKLLDKTAYTQKALWERLGRGDRGLQYNNDKAFIRNMTDLEKLGFITRHPLDEDKRQKIVRITDEGKNAIKKAGEATRRKVTSNRDIDHVFISGSIKDYLSLFHCLTSDVIPNKDGGTELVPFTERIIISDVDLDRLPGNMVDHRPATWLWSALALEKVVLDFDEQTHTFGDKTLEYNAFTTKPLPHEDAWNIARKRRGKQNVMFAPAHVSSYRGRVKFIRSQAVWCRFLVGEDNRRQGNALPESKRMAQLVRICRKLQRHRLLISSVVDTGYSLDVYLLLHRYVKNRKRVRVILELLAEKLKQYGADATAAVPEAFLHLPQAKHLYLWRGHIEGFEKLRTAESQLLFLNQKAKNALFDIEWAAGNPWAARKYPRPGKPPPVM